MMRDLISRHLFSPLQGMTFPLWWSLLQRAGFDVDARYWPRATFQTAVALANVGPAAREETRFGSKIAGAEVLPPVFILGHWRQGTTHLHNLLALDPQLAFPNLFQTLYPRTFLTTEAFIPRLGSFLLMRRRPHDNVSLSFSVPNEDELALCVDSGLSPYLSWAFPRQAAFYDRFLTLHEASDDERARWRQSLVGFLKKLTVKHGRPVVLKSPPHTGRIGHLLDLFPDARFVHIRRNPYQVFRSTQHMYATTMRYWQLQRPPFPDFEDRILTIYRTMYDAFFQERALIPPHHYCDVAYEALVADPIGEVDAIYNALGLVGFATLRPRLQEYLESIGGYERNTHPELAGPVRLRIRQDWRRCFDEWGYALD
jgi:hypothetical protein